MSEKRDFGVFALVAFLFVAAVYLFVPFSPLVLKVITAAVSVCVILIISYTSSKEAASVLTGGITALIYSVLHSFFAVVFGVIPLLSVRTPFMILTGFLIGLIGAVFGGGSKIRRRRRYR